MPIRTGLSPLLSLPRMCVARAEAMLSAIDPISAYDVAVPPMVYAVLPGEDCMFCLILSASKCS